MALSNDHIYVILLDWEYMRLAPLDVQFIVVYATA